MKILRQDPMSTPAPTARYELTRKATLMPGPHRILLTATATLTGALVLAGCGSSSTPAGSTSTATSSATSSASPSGPRSGAAGNLAQIQQCLKVAGIKVPSGLPTGVPTGLPSGRPSGAPTGNFTPPAGGAGSLLSDPKAQAALKACGISLPGPGGTS